MKLDSLKICSIFFTLSLFWLIIDCINGFFIASGISIPISQVFKLFVIFLLMFGILKKQGGIKLIWFIVFYVAWLFFHLNYNTVSPAIGVTINHLFRFVISVLIFFFVRKFTISRPEWSYLSIRKTFNVSTLVVVLNILAGLLGFGYSAYYRGELGLRGFFNAGNELSGVVMVLFPFILFDTGLNHGLKSKRYIVTLLVLLVTVALMGTKTALLAMIFTIPVIPQLYKEKQNTLKLAALLTVSILLLAVVLLFVLDNFGLLDRWIWFLQRGGIERLIFSGRDEFWNEAKVEFFQADFVTRLFGLGESRTVEMDPFDALLNYGYVGVILCYSFYLYLLVLSWKYRKRHKIARLVFYVNVMVLSASSFAGHIIFSGMASWLIALLNTLIYIPNNLLVINKHEK